MRQCFYFYLLIRGRLLCSPSEFSIPYLSPAALGAESDVPSWSELGVKHTVEISKISSEILFSQYETNRLRRQNMQRRQQLQRFYQVYVALRRKLRAQTWQPPAPLLPTSPSLSDRA